MTEPPRKPVWFPEPRPLPDPRNLPGAPLTKPPPKPAPKPQGRVWRLPWPPPESEYWTPVSRRLTATGERYIAACAAVVRPTLVEYARPVRLSVVYYAPSEHCVVLSAYIEPVRNALQALGVWTDARLVRDQRYAWATEDRQRGPVRVTVTVI